MLVPALLSSFCKFASKQRRHKYALLNESAYINGKWCPSKSGETFQVTNPANGDVICSVSDCSVDDVEEAIQSARSAFEGFKNTTAKERSALLLKFYNLQLQHTEELARLMTAENLPGEPVCLRCCDRTSWRRGWDVSEVYLGHKVSAEGIYPTDTKVKAIISAPEPTNVTELRAYLGLLTFYGKFLENFATAAAPLYELLKKDRHWKWTKACAKAFETTKQLLLNSRVLTYYDVNRPIGVSSDASAYGLGAVIFHILPDGSEQPIAFASRTLSTAERNYAQGEKETLAIIFALRRFHRYLYGRKFCLFTDHQPLLGILAPDKPIPSLAAARMQRWAVTLSAYQYSLKYRKGKNMEVADALSRLPLPVPAAEEQEECFALFAATPLTAKEVALATQRDRVLSAVADFTLNGWPSSVSEELRPFYVRRNELSLEQGCLSWGQRVIVPLTLQEQVLTLLHEEHPGMTRMKMLARSFVWWPTLDGDIETRVRHCKVCQSVLPAKPPGPLQPWAYPSRVWQRIHVDYATKEGLNFLVLVDAFSKWIEVFVVSSTTTEKTVRCLSSVFAAYGYPEELVSDNGPQFTAEDFGVYLQRHGIKHTRIPPYHAASNGAAERLVQTTKTTLLKQVRHDQITGGKRTILERVNDFLLAYRNTPNSVTGKTPAELFLKRQPRTLLSLIRPNFAGDMRTKQERETALRNGRRGRGESFVAGDKVLVKTNRGEEVSWEEGLVTQVVSPTTYLVNVNNRTRFIHMDHLRASWASSTGSVFPEIPAPTPSATTEAVPEGSRAGQLPRAESPAPRFHAAELPSQGTGSVPHPEQLLEVPEPDDRQHTQHNASASEPPAAAQQDQGDGSASASSTATTLRRGSRTRKAPDRYQSYEFRRQAK